jgi:TonB family protein
MFFSAYCETDLNPSGNGLAWLGFRGILSAAIPANGRYSGARLWVPMFQDERQPETHLERPSPLPIQNTEVQRKRMLIALGILLGALVTVVVKDWDFWFPPTAEAPEALAEGKGTGKTVGPAAGQSSGARSGGRRPARSLQGSLKGEARGAGAEVPFASVTERAALPPMQVEVVAGNRRTTVPAKSNSVIRLDVGSGATSTAAGAAGMVPDMIVGAGEKVRLSPQMAQSVTVSVPPNYPMLARQMKVQGAVSLEALISRDGSIQQLRVLRGPAILANAAREAVRQWKFKPYLQNGQPVETQARITVNFTISTN